MLNNSNVLAFIGTGESTEYPKNQLVAIEDHERINRFDLEDTCEKMMVDLKNKEHLERVKAKKIPIKLKS